jgi:hypothetical protein
MCHGGAVQITRLHGFSARPAHQRIKLEPGLLVMRVGDGLSCQHHRLERLLACDQLYEGISSDLLPSDCLEDAGGWSHMLSRLPQQYFCWAVLPSPAHNMVKTLPNHSVKSHGCQSEDRPSS